MMKKTFLKPMTTVLPIKLDPVLAGESGGEISQGDAKFHRITDDDAFWGALNDNPWDTGQDIPHYNVWED